MASPFSHVIIRSRDRLHNAGDKLSGGSAMARARWIKLGQSKSSTDDGKAVASGRDEAQRGRVSGQSELTLSISKCISAIRPVHLHRCGRFRRCSSVYVDSDAEQRHSLHTWMSQLPKDACSIRPSLVPAGVYPDRNKQMVVRLHKSLTNAETDTDESWSQCRGKFHGRQRRRKPPY